MPVGVREGKREGRGENVGQGEGGLSVGYAAHSVGGDKDGASPVG